MRDMFLFDWIFGRKKKDSSDYRRFYKDIWSGGSESSQSRHDDYRAYSDFHHNDLDDVIYDDDPDDDPDDDIYDDF